MGGLVRRLSAADDDDDDALLDGIDTGGPVSVIDDWIELQGQGETVRLLSYLRDEIRRCIHLKVLDPEAELPEISKYLLDEALNVLHTATRRQNRLIALLPQQLVLPPGGSFTRQSQIWDREGHKGHHESRAKSKGKGKDKDGKGGGRKGNKGKNGSGDALAFDTQ